MISDFIIVIITAQEVEVNLSSYFIVKHVHVLNLKQKKKMNRAMTRWSLFLVNLF